MEDDDRPLVGGENAPCRSLMKAATWKACTSAGLAPGVEAPRGTQVGPACVVVVDLGGEKLQDAPGGLGGRL